MRNYLFVGGPVDGQWLSIPDSQEGPVHIPLATKFKTNMPDPVIKYQKIYVRCGAEQITVYCLYGMTTGQVLAKMVRNYKC